MKHKKGQALQTLGGLAVGIAVLMLTLTITFLVLSEGRTQASDLTDTTIIANETVTWSNNTFVALSAKAFAAEGSINCITIWNNSADPGTSTPSIIGSGNYSCTWRGLNISDDPAKMGLGISLEGAINVSYSYRARDIAYNSTVTMQNATQDIPGWVPLIVIAMIGIILLSLVALFRRR